MVCDEENFRLTSSMFCDLDCLCLPLSAFHLLLCHARCGWWTLGMVQGALVQLLRPWMDSRAVCSPSGASSNWRWWRLHFSYKVWFPFINCLPLFFFAFIMHFGIGWQLQDDPGPFPAMWWIFLTFFLFDPFFSTFPFLVAAFRSPDFCMSSSFSSLSWMGSICLQVLFWVIRKRVWKGIFLALMFTKERI